MTNNPRPPADPRRFTAGNLGVGKRPSRQVNDWLKMEDREVRANDRL